MQTFRPIDSVEALQERMTLMRKAQREFAKFTQEQVDHIFFEAAMAANKARIPLAKMAVEETGMGVMEDKVIKNHYASEYIYHAYRNTKTVGVLEEDPAFGIKKIAEPIGLVAAVIPTTNPTSTAIFKALLCLKTRNAILISPHPRAKKCTAEAARIVYEAAVKAGAHGVDNDLGSGKLHIGYPHADELVIGIGELHGLIRMENVLTEAVGIHTVGMSAVDYFIKIVFHSNTFPV